MILVVYLYICLSLSFGSFISPAFLPSQRIENLCWISFILNFSAYQVKKKNIPGNISTKKSTFQKKQVPEISEVASNLLSKPSQNNNKKIKKKLESPLPDSKLTFCWIFSTKFCYMVFTVWNMFWYVPGPPSSDWLSPGPWPKMIGRWFLRIPNGVIGWIFRGCHFLKLPTKKTTDKNQEGISVQSQESSRGINIWVTCRELRSISQGLSMLGCS